MKLAGAEKIARYRQAGFWQDRTVYQMAVVAAQGQTGEALVDPINRNDLDGQPPARLSWPQVMASARQMAAVLTEQGVGADDVVIVQAPNIHELVLLYLAVARIGAIISPVPVQYSAHELTGIFAAVKPRACIGARLANGDYVPLLDHARDHGAAVLCLNRPTQGPVTGLRNEDVNLDILNGVNHPSADDCFTLCWTSGTTGTPKGVPRSHNHWHAQGPAMYHGLSMGMGDRMLSPFPFVNMAAIGGSLMGWILGQGTLILHHPFDLATYLQQVAMEKPTVTLLPPAILNLLLKDPALSKQADLTGLRAVGSGSAPLSPWMVQEWQDRGVAVVNIFGSNEGAALLTAPADVPDANLRATCFPRFGQDGTQWDNPISRTTETRLLDPASGAVINRPGQIGELYIRGPNVFEGYWRMDDSETAAEKLFDEDGFFRTGDLFEISRDDPRLMRFVARCKDIVIRGGMNISMEEVDGLLTDHPDLLEAATYAVDDEILGEKLAVAVVAKSGVAITLDDVNAHLRGKGLAVFKLPEVFKMVNQLPRNAMNKIVRHELPATEAIRSNAGAKQ